LLDIDVNYTEKMIVGYRWYDYHKVDPKYPFGHGLSYTTFNYSGMMRIANTVSFNVTNTGSVEGAEVAQVYLVPPKDERIWRKGYDYV
jgi:beta-glucosidase